MIRVEAGDCLEVIPRLVAEGVMVDAVATDPPYGLEFMGEGWDRGVPGIEFWASMLPILRPGGFLLAFGGTRTAHRMVCAIEDAGFVIQDTIAWLYGSGLPKGKALLKPSFEPICVAYKPGGKRVLQVEECRIATDGRPLRESDYKDTDNIVYQGRMNGSLRGGSKTKGETDLGRWPANVTHDGSDEVMAGFAVAGERSSGHLPAGTRPLGKRNTFGNDRRSGYETMRDFGGDTGSAARFFYSSKAGAEDRWGSRHPTVKPVALLKWLVPLVTPPGGLFLDPFAGSGTSGVAALATGRNAILVEQDAGYISDINERLAFYEGTGRHSLASKARHAKDKPGPLL